jgi:hypothetical protein
MDLQSTMLLVKSQLAAPTTIERFFGLIPPVYRLTVTGLSTQG